MRFKKSDWTLISEAENAGLLVGMTGEVTPKRTELNNELSAYFRTHKPKYTGSFDEYDGEEVLYAINEFLEEHNLDKHALAFPISSGTDVHLIPINENISLKVIVADEYYGDGDYSKYVMADYFMINENTTKEDVDILIEFINKYLTV